MMSADVEGSLAAFFPAAALPLDVGGGVPEALPLVAPSACVLFFFFAISQATGSEWPVE